jgi:hypothetical protein
MQNTPKKSWFRRALEKIWELFLYPFIIGIVMAAGELLIRAIVFKFSSQDTIFPFVLNNGGLKQQSQISENKNSSIGR